MAKQDRSSNDPAVAAMDAVLEAERAGLKRLEESQARAKAITAEANARAAALGRRADARIAVLHAAYLDKIEMRIAGFGAAPPGKDGAPSEEALKAAVGRLAAKLAGGA